MISVSKIKINLTNGSIVEKPLVSAFAGTNGNYVILDNETNGSMGLPVVCVSKLNGTALEKIFDQNEWGAVKENLKTIIGGGQLNYLAVADSLTAQDDFFTQLALPVASFDLLKNAYKPPVVEQPVQEVAPAALETPQPIVEPTPVMPDLGMPQVIEPNILGGMGMPNPSPVMETPAIVTPEPASPVVDMPAMPVMPEAVQIPPVMQMDAPTIPVENSVPTINPVAPVMPEPMEKTEIVNSPSADEIRVLKENFMKSCENMFDALIKKFENK